MVDKKLPNNWRCEAEKISIRNFGLFFEREKKVAKMSADHEVRRAHRRKSFQIGWWVHRTSLSLTQRNMQCTSRVVADYLSLSEKCSFFFEESYFEVREVDSLYVVSQARGRETRRTMSGAVVRSFLVEFVTGQVISAQFFWTAWSSLPLASVLKHFVQWRRRLCNIHYGNFLVRRRRDVTDIFVNTWTGPEPLFRHSFVTREV